MLYLLLVLFCTVDHLLTCWEINTGLVHELNPLLIRPDEPAREYFATVKARLDPCSAAGVGLLNQVQTGPY